MSTRNRFTRYHQSIKKKSKTAILIFSALLKTYSFLQIYNRTQCVSEQDTETNIWI